MLFVRISVRLASLSQSLAIRFRRALVHRFHQGTRFRSPVPPMIWVIANIRGIGVGIAGVTAIAGAQFP